MTRATRMLTPNDPVLTVEKLNLKRIVPGMYEHTNRATGTTWLLQRRALSGQATWVFFNADDNHEGGGDVFYSKAEAMENLVHYLRGRYRDPRLGWCTRDV